MDVGLDAFLDGNFLFLIGMAINGVLFSTYLGDEVTALRVSSAIAERENDTLRELDRAKTDFIMNVSHELRTPLRVIDGTIGQLRDGRWGDSIKANAPHLNTVERNSRKLLKQINNLLDLSTIQQGSRPLRVASVDLFSVLTRLIKEIRPTAERRGIRIESHIKNPLPATVDPELFENAFLNLMSNAARHTDEEGRISVAAYESKGTISVIVDDDGVGIPAEEHDRVFERFYQAKAHGDRKCGGSGLGLSLVREIVSMHGGSVELTSEPGSGTKIEMRFPQVSHPVKPYTAQAFADGSRDGREKEYLADVEPAVSPLDTPVPEKEYRYSRTVSQSKDGSALPVVLVIEDSADLRRLISSELSPHFVVYCAKGGDDAIEWLKHHVPDLIISDIMMPGTDGYDVLHYVRSDIPDDSSCSDEEHMRRIGATPFLFLTARSDIEEQINAINSDAVDYIVKPFVTDELVARAKRIVETHRHSREYVTGEVKRSLTTLLESVDSLFDTDSQRPGLPVSTGQLFREANLTKREIEIATLVAEGLSDKEIAVELGLSAKTIGNHNTVIFRKLGVTGRVAVVRLASR